MKLKLEEILLQISFAEAIDQGDLNATYHLVIESIMEGLELKRAGIWFWHEERSAISCQLLIDRHNNTVVDELVIPADAYPQYFKALNTERSILAHDAHTHPDTFEFSESYLCPLGINSMLDIPIRHAGKMIGVICCEHIGPKRQWQNDEAHFVASLSDLIGRTINAHEQQQLRLQLRDMNEHLEDLVKQRTEQLDESVAELQNARSQLVESEKLAALGSLVAGVAHEVNTPLGIAITSGSSVQEEIQNIANLYHAQEMSEDKFKTFLEHIDEASRLLMDNLHRASVLIQNFKQTAVDQCDESEHRFDLKVHLDHLISSLVPKTKQIPVIPQLQMPSQTLVRSYPSAWGQIFTNLILNSCRHAFDHTEHAIIEISGCKNAKGELEITYCDNGKGVEPDNIKKIMEPFYTTKRGKGGTGLGLSIVHNLIHGQLKGRLKVESRLGEGMRFHITCPSSIWVGH